MKQTQTSAASADRRAQLVLNSASGEELARVPESTVQEIDRAVKRADECFRGDWRRRTPRERSAALLRLAALVRDRAEDLALLESRNVGKPLVAARAEVLSGADCFEYYAGAVTKITGDTIPVSAPGLCP